MLPGVRIYELQKPMLHAKAMAVDGARGMVGSFDVNVLERRNTREVAVIAEDPLVAAGIEAGFSKGLLHSKTIIPAEWAGRSRMRRLAERLSYRLVSR
jgi:phosphatidylserine/phosphatidylglycerophosphate/cardiolipin synthase-like enzyme